MSSNKEVTSGVVKGSVLGPDLYNVIADSLVCRFRLSRVAYADDFKFVSDVALCSQTEILTEINTVADWSVEYHMPLSLDKCSVMHCGIHQPLHNYVLNNCVMKAVGTLPDFGVKCTSDGGYFDYCEIILRKASRVAGAIWHVFRCRRRELMWVAFQHYVLPIVMYGSPIWNPTLQRDINLLESVQRCFTKQITGLKELPYSDRLKSLGALIT